MSSRLKLPKRWHIQSNNSWMAVLGCFGRHSRHSFVLVHTLQTKDVKPVSVNLLLQFTKQIRNLHQESISAQDKMRQTLRDFFGQLLWFYSTAKAARFFVFQLFQLKLVGRCLRSHSFCKSSWHDSDPGVGNQWFEPVWPTVGSYGLGFSFFEFFLYHISQWFAASEWRSFHFSCQWHVYLEVNHHQTHLQCVLDSSCQICTWFRV